MTLIEGSVEDVGMTPMSGVLTVRTARFRPSGEVLYAPEAIPFPIVNGQVAAELAPGPAVLTVKVGSHAQDRFEVVIPDQVSITLADLIETVFSWEPEQINKFITERKASEAAATAAGLSAAAAVAAKDRAILEHEHVHLDAAHVDAVAAQLPALLDQANVFAQDQVPPYLQDAELKRTYGTKADLEQEAQDRLAATATLGTSKLGKVAASLSYARRDDLADLADSLTLALAPAASQMVLEQAQVDGWAAVYDPGNTATRTLVAGKISELRDGLGTSPPLVQANAAARPALVPRGIGALTAAQGGATATSLAAAFPAPKANPVFILTVTKPSNLGTAQALLDGVSATQRNSILIAADRRWSMYAGAQWYASATATDVPVVVGALYNGANSLMWINGQQYSLDGDILMQPLGGLTLGSRHAENGTHWRGGYGPVLLYQGVPSAAVRDRMTDLLRSLVTPYSPAALPQPSLGLTASSALSVDPDGTVLYEKAADTLAYTASTVKLLTALTARTVLSNLDQQVTITSADVDSWIQSLKVGDVISVRDLFAGMMIPSHNDCARAVGRIAGMALLSGAAGDPMSRFMTEMHTYAASKGMTGAVFGDTSGLQQTSRLSARHLTAAMREALADGPLMEIMSSLTWQLTITGGPDPRTRTLTHTIDPDGEVKLPEFVAGKTGTNGPAHAVIAWAHPVDGRRHVSSVVGSTAADRFTDLRKIIDYAVSVG